MRTQILRVGLKHHWLDWINRQEVFVFILLLFAIVFLSLTTTTFLTTNNLQNVSRNLAWIAIPAFGESLVILIGGIDLSVGAVMALSGLVTALALQLGSSNPPGDPGRLGSRESDWLGQWSAGRPSPVSPIYCHPWDGGHRSWHNIRPCRRMADPGPSIKFSFPWPGRYHFRTIIVPCPGFDHATFGHPGLHAFEGHGSGKIYLHPRRQRASLDSYRGGTPSN